jgi:hypothetical protein
MDSRDRDDAKVRLEALRQIAEIKNRHGWVDPDGGGRRGVSRESAADAGVDGHGAFLPILSLASP